MKLSNPVKTMLLDNYTGRKPLKVSRRASIDRMFKDTRHLQRYIIGPFKHSPDARIDFVRIRPIELAFSIYLLCLQSVY